MTAPLFFAHANGFPSRCYQTLLSALSVPEKIYEIDKIGHHPHYPVTDSWPYLVREYLDQLWCQAGNKPVIGMGHSLGGILTLYAALLRPQAFQGIILLDPPLCNGFKSWLFYLLKCFGRTHWVTPGRDRVRDRRSIWETREAAIAYFQSISLFQSFSESAFADFIEYGLEKTDLGYQLTFHPHIEAEIFKTLPHDVSRDLPKLSVPGYFLYGQMGSVVGGWDRRYIQHRTPLRLEAVPGTHLFPLEHPIETARVVERCITAMIGETYGKNLVETISARGQQNHRSRSNSLSGASVR